MILLPQGTTHTPHQTSNVARPSLPANPNVVKLTKLDNEIHSILSGEGDEFEKVKLYWDTLQKYLTILDELRQPASVQPPVTHKPRPFVPNPIATPTQSIVTPPQPKRLALPLNTTLRRRPTKRVSPYDAHKTKRRARHTNDGAHYKRQSSEEKKKQRLDDKWISLPS